MEGVDPGEREMGGEFGDPVRGLQHLSLGDAYDLEGPFEDVEHFSPGGEGGEEENIQGPVFPEVEIDVSLHEIHACGGVGQKSRLEPLLEDSAQGAREEHPDGHESGGVFRVEPPEGAVGGGVGSPFLAH